ncbi:MAG: GGDEF domain-containing protein [Phycisphaerae bacterium]|jgi:diguanylate cyclase (GGDEF)-like protein
MDTKSLESLFVVLSADIAECLCMVKALNLEHPEIKLNLLAEAVYEPLMIRLRDKGAADSYYCLPLTATEFGCAAATGSIGEGSENSYEKKIRELEDVAGRDELTGLRNRRFFTMAANELLSLPRELNISATVIEFDIDNFKAYNDAFGHTTGDEIIKDTARAIQNSFRHHDIVARIGGDEFAVLLWDIDLNITGVRQGHERRHYDLHPGNAANIAGRIRSRLSNVKNRCGVLTISGGLAHRTDAAADSSSLLALADEALMRAKAQGKNTILF